MLKLNKSILSNLISLGISFFGFFPLIPKQFKGIGILFLGLFSLVHFFFTRRKRIYRKTFFITSFLYFILLVSVLYSSNQNEGLQKMETMLSILIFPIIFYLLLGESFLDFSKVRIYFIKTYYITSLLFTTISFFSFIIYQNPKYLSNDSNFYRNSILDSIYLGGHPIYVSIYIAVAIIFGFYLFDKVKNNYLKKFLLLIAQIYLLLLLFLLMSKGVILALIIVFIFNGIRERRRNKFFTIGFVLSLVLFFVLIPGENNRFKEIINLDSYQKLDQNNSTSLRVLVYKCGVDVLSKTPFKGNGLGDVQDLLNTCYSHNQYSFPRGIYNSHNQYLFIWLASGAVGFLIFLAVLFYYFKKAIQYKDSIMLSVLILYCVIFLFENILSRQSGVILFCFLSNYFLWDNFISNKIVNQKPSFHMKKLIILQTASPSYRTKLYIYISEILKDNFQIYSGDCYFEESIKTDLSFDKRKKIKNYFFLKRNFLFQRVKRSVVISNNLLVLEMNPRIISNWIYLLIRKLLNRKTILWGHAWPREGALSKTDRLRNIMRLLADHIIVYTKTQQVELKKRMPNKKIHAAVNSLYTIKEMTTNKGLNISENIIYVGRLTAKKKPLLLVKGFHSVLHKLPSNTKLLIIGEGPEKLKIEQYVKQEHLNLRVQILGHIDNYETLKKMYYSSLFSVSPGYVGLSITQSFGFGVPMVISKNENHSPEIEAVSEGRNAVYFKTDDFENLGKVIQNMFETKDFWQGQRGNILENCKKEYSIDAMSATFINLYHQYIL